MWSDVEEQGRGMFYGFGGFTSFGCQRVAEQLSGFHYQGSMVHTQTQANSVR